MQLVYRGFAFASDAQVVAVRKRALRTGLDQIYGHSVQFDVSGMLLGNGQADLAQQAALLEATLRLEGGNLVFLRSDGVPAMTLANATSITNVRVIDGPNYPNGEGAEFDTYRTFTFTAEAEYQLVPGQTVILEYAEALDAEGGGPVFDFIPVVNGPQPKTMLFAETPVLVTQSGMAVGLNAYPTPPPPLFPGAQLRALRRRRERPKRLGRYPTVYPVSWEYRFGSTGPLAGLNF